jgi:hypothetical protein
LGFGAVLLAAAAACLLVPRVLATSPAHPRFPVGVGMELAAGSGTTTGSQQSEPEGVDTTDPEASDEDGSGAPNWLVYVLLVAITAVLLVWYLRRLNRQDSAEGH